MHTWKKIDHVFSVLINVTYVAMIIVVSLQILSRAIPFLKAPAWTEEGSRYLMVYLVAFSAGLAIKADSFVAVDTLKLALGARKGAILDIVINCFLIVFFSVFFYGAIKFFILGMPQNSISMPIFPMSAIYFSLLILAVQVITNLIRKMIGIILQLKTMEIH